MDADVLTTRVGAQGLLLERRLFMKLCLSDAALSRMRAYDEQDSASLSRVT